MKKHKLVLVVGDTHFPFANRRLIKKVADLAYQLSPTHIIQVGDLYDFYNASRFPKNHDIITPSDEIKKGRAQAAEMWWLLHRRAPKAKKWQLRGNHDVRYDQRLTERFPEALSFFEGDPKGLFRFDNVETVMDSKEELIIGDTLYQHGHRSRLGDHARYNQMNTVHGHSHHGGVVFLRNLNKVYFELDVGWLGDETQPVFAYGAQKRIKTMTTGIGIIDAHGPRFVPLT